MFMRVVEGIKTVIKSAALVAAALTVLVASTIPAKAADSQKHYYGFLLGALASGIPTDVAVAMALGNEMIDRGIWTSPMGLPTPRLLYHFMGTPVSFSVDEGAGKRMLAIATIKHPLFYNLLDQGLKTRNPVFIGAALHLLIDTFYHAGYSNLLGHAEGGHRPDMPYQEIQKARQCFQAIIEMTFLLRDMTTQNPDLDVMRRIVTDVMKEPVYKKTLEKVTGASEAEEVLKVVARRPDIFSQILLDHDLVRNAFFTNVEKSDAYTKIMIPQLIEIFNKQGYTKLSPEDVKTLSTDFADVAARTDLDPMQTMKVIMYRILQAQDPLLQRLSDADVEQSAIKSSSEALRAQALDTKIDFSRLAGFSDRKGFQAHIDIEAKKNEDAFRFMLANAEIFRKQIEVVDANGTRRFLKSNEWNQKTNTMAETVLPEVLSWLHLFNPTDGQLRPIEHRDVGHLVSTQTDTDWMRNLLDMNPDHFGNIQMIFSRVEKDPRLLQIAARLKALAESAYHLANNQTKDLIPNKMSPIQHVNYEDDSLPHACFAKECRMDAMKNLLIEMANIKVESEPMGFFAYVKSKIAAFVKSVKHAVLLQQVEREIQNKDHYLREYVYEIGLGTKDEHGNIVLPEDREDVFRVSPNLTLRGYRKWTASTWRYVVKVMLKLAKPKNAQIQAYIANGERMKSDVVQVLQEKYYGTKANAELPMWWVLIYGRWTNTGTPQEWGVTGATPLKSCSALFSR